MKKYTVKSNRNIQIRRLLAFKGESQLIKYEFHPWIEENGIIDSINVEVKNGQASAVVTPDFSLTDGNFIPLDEEYVISSVLTDLTSTKSGDTITVTGGTLNDGTYIASSDGVSVSGSSYKVPIVGSLIILTSQVCDLHINGIGILITTSESGSSLIKLTVTSGSEVFVTHLRVVAKDPSVHAGFPRDYV